MSTELERLSIEKLFEVYKQEVNHDAVLSDYASRYRIPLTKAGRLNYSIVYENRRSDLRAYLLKAIKDARIPRPPPPPPPPTAPMKPAPKLIEHYVKL